MTPTDRIKQEAETAYPTEGFAIAGPTYSILRKGYIAGATAEHDRVQPLVDALEAIIKNGENIRSLYKTEKPAFYIKIAREALEQWEGKEVGDEM